jgi:hypothetical protein
MADLNSALIAFIGVLVGGYFNNFLAEDFRRFRDGQALAGALAGELEALAETIPEAKGSLTMLHAIAKVGAEFTDPEWPEPTSPIYEANLDKLGLLGAKVSKEVVFVYEAIQSYRGAIHHLFKHQKTQEPVWRVAVIEGGAKRLKAGEARSGPLIQELIRHSEGSYWSRPEARRGIAVGIALIVCLIASVIFSSRETSHGEQCTTTLDQGALHTTCK